MLEESSRELVGSGRFCYVKSCEKSSGVACAEEEKRGGLGRVSRLVACVACVFGYCRKRELGREGMCKKVGFVGSIMDPCVRCRLQWRYVQSWRFVVEKLSVDFPPLLGVSWK